MKYVIFSIFLFIKYYYFYINLLIISLAIMSIMIHNYYDKKILIVIMINIILELLFNYYLINNQYLFIFTSKILQFISSIKLNELICSNKKSVTLLTPYILWNFILTLFSITVLFFII